MSAIKKQSPLRWACTSERTSNGRLVISTTHTASFCGFDLSITNYPGTRTLDWRITKPGTQFWNAGNEDRFEYTVAILKDRLYAKVLGLKKALDAQP